MKLLLTGASGMVGSRVTEILSNTYEIIPLSTSIGVDLTDSKTVLGYFSQMNPDLVVHLAAKANVDECEKDKELDLRLVAAEINKGFDVRAYCEENAEKWNGNNSSFAANIIGTFNIAKAATQKNLPFIYISTDFVFDGTKDEYQEDDAVNPIDWYGMTKYLGEKLSRELLPRSVIARISYPFGVSPSPKKDFVRKMADFLKEKGALTLISDQIVTPTYIDDIVKGVDFILSKSIHSETLHLVGSSSLTPYEIGEKLAEKLEIKANFSKVSGHDFFKERAPRPFILKMKNDKLDKLGFQTLTFDEGLDQLIPGLQ